MEKESPSKPSVAELAGRFKGHILPMPTANDEVPFRRRPPCSLKLHTQTDDNHNEDAQKPLSSPNPLKVRTRNSALIEKLQANLALSPTALLPSPKSPDVKLPPAPLSPTSPQTPQSPAPSPALRPSQSSEEEEPVSFETPPEGSTLPSLHKTRARLSFKRRPPTRQHRRSAQEEEEEEEEEGEQPSSPLSPQLPGPKENGLSGDQVFDSPAVGDTAPTDCQTIEEEGAVRSPSHEEDTAASEERDLEKEESESEPCSVESEGTEGKEDEMTEEVAEDKNE